jgi:cell division protein FtsW
VSLYSGSWAFSERFYNRGFYLIGRQLAFAAAGVAMFIAAAFVRLETVRRFIPAAVVVTIALCALTFVPYVGVIKNGAARWIHIGPWSYQPSELVKLVLPLYLAHMFDKKRDKLNTLAGIAGPVLVTVTFFVIIYNQNNFSTALFVMLSALAVFYLAGIRASYFISAVFLLIPVSAFMVLTKEYRLRRLISFLWPDWEPLGAGYQVNASVLTIASGGFWGRGLGQGTRKISSVPEVANDFVFSAFAEENGFAGVAAFLLLWGLFLFRSYKAALACQDMWRRLIVFGLATTIAGQTLANLAVVSGSLPATGIPLPLFSAGGSSLATTLIMAGLIVNAAKTEEEQDV